MPFSATAIKVVSSLSSAKSRQLLTTSKKAGEKECRKEGSALYLGSDGEDSGGEGEGQKQ